MKLSLDRMPTIHPFLFAAFPVVFLYSRNIQQLPLHIILLPLAIVISSTAIALLLLRKFGGNSEKIAIYVSIFWIWFFSYDSVRSLISYDIYDLQIYRHKFFIFIWIFAFIMCVIIIYRIKDISSNIRNYLNLVGIFLILSQIFIGAVNYLSYHSNVAKIDNNLRKIKTENVFLPKDSLPPIYYIILDAYAGANELKEILNYDNSTFIEYLQSREFYVAENSHSNYSWTALCMSSTLNMQYLPTDNPLDNPAEDFKLKPGVPYLWLVRNNQVLHFLESIGYSFVNLASYTSQGFYYRDASFNSFNVELLKKTILEKPVAENYIEGIFKRQEIRGQFQKLEEVINSKEPIFTYVHILIPHEPYVFDQNGHQPPFRSMALQLESEKKLYLDQLIFANKMVQKVIEKILTRSQKQPIIIIQGDHGAPARLGRDPEENRRLRMSILNAYYFPQGGSRVLYKSITPVNSFRLMFNYYFGQKLPLLKDESYFVLSMNSSNLIRMTPKLTK